MAPPSLSVVYTHVFEAEAGGGNPALVVLNSPYLTSERMHRIAAAWEGETAFVVDPQQADVHARIRFYAPQYEMDICVHAMIGTVSTLVEHGGLVKSPARIETLSGIITVEWTEGASGREVTVEQFPPSFGNEAPSLEEVAAVLRLPQTAIRLDWGPIQSVSTARAKVIVPIADYRTLDSLQPDFEGLWSLCDRYHATGFYPFTLSTRSKTLQMEARQFPNRVGFNEDAATGVAACALGAYLTEHEVLQPKAEGWQTFTIGQGYAMGRPSMLVAETWVENGVITRTRVRGRTRLQAMLLIRSRARLPSVIKCVIAKSGGRCDDIQNLLPAKQAAGFLLSGWGRELPGSGHIPCL